ncbi:winged helix-turn-helix domain-containing protein [Enterococcus raffinosus]|uniref:Helix-turn-helix domain-containing protein n=1 Tax=Enterococcus raffinosus TaxID=71452 RepID=A0AAW8T8W6_9ENTE|nr:helix-turn-helix domain-containing protein [Enterococcus raffinosus]MDT2523245.1 helix-turn-helix domain-containing protein [Enterococcus raffinosus]MDT2531263.1 helix-turn-helix domain-containing protein [Enterococcus raffinosus]MDT2533935.1 helix-turn-helix domain-containing protein [Enterococcus raffinosus]MDT2544722.1 helix-turn-helix domain-containing protein [Enterococcus raffinosus]MDT2555994.1 helix-turn-helix domain-containing protein [Enterococcus raffinosus]
MMRILLLSNYKDYGDTFYNNLIKLGHDVFYTTLDLNLFRNPRKKISSISQIFSVVIFDETISNSKIVELLPHFKGSMDYIFRKIGENLAVDTMQCKKKVDDFEYIYKETPIDELRELFEKINEESHFLNRCIESLYNVEAFNFSKKEKLIYEYLLNHRNQIVTRETLCKECWNNSVTQSSLSSLSICISKIRKKLEQEGFPSKCLITYWKKGYMLDFKVVF